MAQSFCTMYLYMYIYYSIIYYLYTYIDNTFIDVYLYLFIIMYKYIYICVCVCMYTATQRERMESMLCQCFVACVIVFTHWLSAAMRWSELDQTNRRTLRSALSRSSVVCPPCLPRFHTLDRRKINWELPKTCNLKKTCREQSYPVGGFTYCF